MIPNLLLIQFLRDHSNFLVSDPVNGCELTIWELFNSTSDPKLSYEEFQSEIQTLIRIDPHCIIRSNVDDSTIEFINHHNLNLLKAQFEEAQPTAIQKGSSQKTTRPTTAAAFSLDYLNTLLAPTTHEDTYHYDYLVSLLNHENTGQKLSKLKIAKTTLLKPFVEICSNSEHSKVLSQRQQNTKLPKDVHVCFDEKIHFIPVIKPHTDLSLGDCSYLDTCHKLATCRYIHYLKHIPNNKLRQEQQKCLEFNNEISYWEKINPWSNNGAVSNISRDVLGPQWISCDVTNFDFNILGKFAAVIADPAWNIHMNLPYGTCNDNELLNLPLSNIQDEGIILLWVTGRAIEIGKESLMRWGYTMKNEMIWVKTNQLSRTICTGRTGHWLNHSKEHLLVGVKGNPEWLDKLIDLDVIVSSTRETSRKPDELYGMVERIVGPHARKLEIFGRDHNTRPGWFSEWDFISYDSEHRANTNGLTAIGNQLKGNRIEEIDVLERYNQREGSK